MNIAAILIVASAACGVQPEVPGLVVKKEDIPKDLPAEVRVQVEKLCSKSVDDRLRALGALGKMKAKAAPAVPFLVASLGDNGMETHMPPSDPITGRDMGRPMDEFVWQAASWALTQVGKPAADPLLEAAKDENRTIRFRALYTLVEMKDPRAVQPLIDLLNDPKATKPWRIVRLLGRTGDERAVEPLIDYLISQSDNSFSQRGVLEALEKIGRPPKDLAPLLKTLKDKDRMTRVHAAVTLGKMKDPRAVEPLIDTLKTDPESWVRGAAAEGLGHVGDARAVEPIIKFIKTSEGHREYAVLALGQIGGDKATDTLLMLLNDKSRKIRDCAAAALGEIGDRRTVPRIMELLEDPGYQAPYSAYDTLRKLTGQKVTGRRQDWLKWWAENREEFLKGQ